MLAPILLSAVANELAGSLLTADRLPLTTDTLDGNGPGLAGLPRGMSFSIITVTPHLMRLDGNWVVAVDDPRPFFQDVYISAHPTQEEEPEEPAVGAVWLNCAPIIGAVLASGTQTANGTEFTYARRALHTTIKLGISPEHVPGPFTYGPWTMRVGYRDTYGYHDIVVGDAYPLEPGVLQVTSLVWLPEPPLHGTVEQRTFPVTVRGDHRQIELDLPAEAANVVLSLDTEVTDGLGRVWKPSGDLDVHNLTIDLGDAFPGFQEDCARTRRNLYAGRDADLKDKITHESLADTIQHAIRDGDPVLVARVESAAVQHGFKAVAASMTARLRHGWN